MLPRIPFAADFWAFSRAGRKLGQWHLNYETVEPYPLTEDTQRLVMEAGDYRVSKMSFGKQNGKPDKKRHRLQHPSDLRDIPPEAYNYIVNGKSAIEWIMERYQVTVDKDSGIQNDPNDWSDDPRYIVDLLRRVVRVSLNQADCGGVAGGGGVMSSPRYVRKHECGLNVLLGLNKKRNK